MHGGNLASALGHHELVRGGGGGKKGVGCRGRSQMLG